MNVSYEASNLTHPSLEADFVGKAKKDLGYIYLTNTETLVYEENNVVLGFVSMVYLYWGNIAYFAFCIVAGVKKWYILLSRQLLHSIYIFLQAPY